MFHILDFMFSVNGCIKDMHVYNLHYSEKNRSKDYNSQSPALPKQTRSYIHIRTITLHDTFDHTGH